MIQDNNMAKDALALINLVTEVFLPLFRRKKSINLSFWLGKAHAFDNLSWHPLIFIRITCGIISARRMLKLFEWVSWYETQIGISIFSQLWISWSEIFWLVLFSIDMLHMIWLLWWRCFRLRPHRMQCSRCTEELVTYWTFSFVNSWIAEVTLLRAPQVLGPSTLRVMKRKLRWKILSLNGSGYCWW